jgi:hypothetical protein
MGSKSSHVRSLVLTRSIPPLGIRTSIVSGIDEVQVSVKSEHQSTHALIACAVGDLFNKKIAASRETEYKVSVQLSC